MSNGSSRERAWFRPAGDAHPVETALRLTAIELLLRPLGPWFVRPALLGLAALSLIVPRALTAPVTWLVTSFFVGLYLYDSWPLADNHIYLLAYWCLAVGIALRQTDVASALGTSSRWLIGLAFLFAVLWKAVLSPDFLDGRFFRVTLITDPRFADAAILFGGLTPETLDQDRRALASLPEGAELLEPLALIEPAPFKRLVAISTWGVLFFEACVALACLASGPGLVRRIRHYLLLGFCLITYAIAPVAGFGWLLLVMGLAQCKPDEKWIRGVYVAAFFLVLFYTEVPWTALLVDWQAS